MTLIRGGTRFEREPALYSPRKKRANIEFNLTSLQKRAALAVCPWFRRKRNKRQKKSREQVMRKKRARRERRVFLWEAIVGGANMTRYSSAVRVSFFAFLAGS